MNKNSDSKKLTLIYLQNLFLKKTDKTHFLTMKDILSYLETKDIYVDRRTIYNDISLLNYSGFEIIGVKEKGGYKYHHPQRLFNSDELKFLIDSVAASKFLTERKSKELITKIKSLGSSFDSVTLNRNVLLGKRIKSMNDKVFKNLDSIYLALAFNNKIEFQYIHSRFNPTTHRVEHFSKNKRYCLSPFAVSLSDDNYYLIAFDNVENILKHYRIDRMQSIKILDDTRDGMEYFKNFDIVDYSKKTFGMFAGKEVSICLECPNNMVIIFKERFGDSAIIRPNYNNPDTFFVRIPVNLSPQFYGWLFGLGNNVKIISPDYIIDEYKNILNSTLQKYTP